MRHPTLRQLRTFLAIVETASVSLAARAVGLTQPAASQQLRELERVLDVRLFDRAAGRFILTPAGRSLLEPAQRALAAADDAVASMLEHRSGETGRVRVGTGATACIYILPGVLHGSKQAMPGLNISVSIGNTADLLQRLEAGDLDIALVTMPRSVGPSLSATHLAFDPLVALLPEAARSHRRAIAPEELGTLPLILYETGGQSRAITDGWFQRAGVEPKPIMELGSVEAIKVLVAAGLGSTVLPGSALGVTPAGTVVVELQPPVDRELGYVMRREKIRDRGLRIFISELERAAPRIGEAFDLVRSAPAANGIVLA
ncbi:LysR family transcriptional regulator [Rhizobiaceae bacterium BDR2-2]|uniref:LysR family transcriptional regulator n=1 Tax=Ectorhizobium quercum TaxID=2965071 RepID=A0AAE3SUG2_9HYPH|nr:LysR family transcriptional regulator [Ectorhizobium quercum]MCX8997042.1 LysR family transcriptional regulator [Ectorhizobium quercum]